MSDPLNRLQIRRLIEAAVVNLSILAALACSAWIIRHFVTLAFSTLALLMP